MTRLKTTLTHQNAHPLPSSEYVWQGSAAGAERLSKVGLREPLPPAAPSPRYLHPDHPIGRSAFAARAEKVFTDFSSLLPRVFAVPRTQISCQAPLPFLSPSHAGTAKDREPHQRAQERGFVPAHPWRYPENHSGASRADEPQLCHAQQQ